LHDVLRLLTPLADNREVTWKNKTIVLAAGAVSALVGVNVGSAATNDPWIVFAASPNHGTQAPQLFRVRASCEPVETGRNRFARRGNACSSL
jgi:hypothetical protein